MCFDSDAEIIAGTSLGGVKLLDHVTTYWDALDSTYTLFPQSLPHTGSMGITRQYIPW